MQVHDTRGRNQHLKSTRETWLRICSGASFSFHDAPGRKFLASKVITEKDALATKAAVNSFKNNLDIFGAIKKCTINLDVILPEPETEV